MADNTDFKDKLSAALVARQERLEKTELPRLKEEFRVFHTAYYSLYKLLISRGLIHTDPYKAEVKIGEIMVPETGAFTDAERLDQLSLRLSAFDNQLDFLVNFYQLSIESLTLDKIKLILGLVKYIDWAGFTFNSQQPNTKALVELVNRAKNGADTLSMSIINEALSNLNKTTNTILNCLKEITGYNREAYKLEVRKNITSAMSPAEASQPAQIKKKFTSLMPGRPYYPDLIDELIREDYSRDRDALQEKVLKQLAVPENKPIAVKPKTSFKSILIEGLFAIGSVSPTLLEIIPKIDENEHVLKSRQKGFWDKVKLLLNQMLNKEPEPAIYEVEYLDTTRGVPVKEKVNLSQLRIDMERKARILQNLNPRGGGSISKLENIDELQLTTHLEKNIRDIQSLHKTISALDDFFKVVVAKEERDKIKGVKPELATIKNAIVKANQKRFEYSAQKEEEEQLKHLGIGLE
jgi:hypothetical protein